jgi:hypothetical protein
MRDRYIAYSVRFTNTASRDRQSENYEHVTDSAEYITSAV